MSQLHRGHRQLHDILIATASDRGFPHGQEGQSGIDESLKRLVASKGSGEHAPPSLKERLRQQIRPALLEQVAVDITTVEMHTSRFERRG